MFAVFKKSRLFNLSIDCQLGVFDKILKPILLYGCEIWGFSNLDTIEWLTSIFVNMYNAFVSRHQIVWSMEN